MKHSGPIRMIGTSQAILDLQDELQRVARSDAKVLITGESGAGKEVVARAIHAASPRADEIFVAVNCGGIAETLLESELFGHVKGSFTGAYRDKAGKFETAIGGTIFLDEIGEMTLRMQALLLRFLETGEIQKVGADRQGRASDVRVIAATNGDLRELIAQGKFREDLFYRLNVIHVIVPPLRSRKEDIPLLVDFFLQGFIGPRPPTRKAPAGKTATAAPATASSSASRRKPWRRSATTPGQATFVSWRIWSSGSSSPASIPSFRSTICRPKFARRTCAGSRRAASGAARWRPISIASWSRIASRSGRRYTRST